jgi:acetyltransferase-like isoleucine patch superfamily enzyme
MESHGAVIPPRVKIGDGAIVGAVVLRDIARGPVFIGSPARVVGTRS